MKVTIFQYRLFHYRRQLFELLREKCRVHGIDLVLVHGQPYRDEIKKKDDAVLPWATQVRNRYFPVREKKDLCWQPTPELVRGSDLVVLMQENRLLANYVWLLRRMLGTGPLLAFWGHGRDFQSRAPGGLRERWKSLLINRVDWWFAYTSVTAQVLHDAGFPHDRITVLDNAVDNPQFERDLACVSEPDRVAMRTELGLN